MIANEPDAPEMVESVPTPAKPKKKRGKKRRFRRRHGRDRFSPELHRFWKWEELYNSALSSLIQSLAVGRKITAKALVKMASDIADQGSALVEKRTPPEVVAMNEIEEQALRLAPANTYTSSDITALWATIDALRAEALALQPTLKTMLLAARIDAGCDICKAAEEIIREVLPGHHTAIDRLRTLADKLRGDS